MIYKKKRITKNLEALVDYSNKIKAITKTRFLNELEREKKKKIYPKNILDYIFSDLEGKDVEHLRKQLKRKVEDVLSFIDKSEEETIKNILKKVKHTHTILTMKKNPLIPHLLKDAEEKKKN